MKPNAELQAQYAEFCQNMLERIAAGKPPVYGLCTSLSVYREQDDTEIEHYQRALFEERDAAMAHIPFDQTQADYEESRREGTLYQNEARLTWLRQHAGVPE